ncbi:non-homologous end-joining DNA ligase [Methylacidiphilum caldifontis]|uniref:non-homologous end-joining DNA ligase n=1 Tax=Methylacidiphilum caldifontis TaxID=2795386 RepID=UPI001A8D348F|nr:non-homologous end-joining DNA ligase [Methylacidiphilum caldifontis]QSR88550.1 non-homologous end-joining DNA ligase [Methylacidiphilum caldifontis]
MKLDLLGLPKLEPQFLEPMLAQPAYRQIPYPGWMYEPKIDGMRIIAVKFDNQQIILFSRRKLSENKKFPAILKALSSSKEPSWIIDGEIAALDPQGKPSFSLLQTARENSLTIFYLFDLLSLRKRDLRGLPLRTRKELLQHFFHPLPSPIRLLPHFTEQPEKVFAKIKELNFEGVIAKRADSLYESGKRSSSWLKFKFLKRQEFIIIGWTEPKGSLRPFGALLLGYYQDHILCYAGRVGTGFSEKIALELYTLLKNHEIVSSPLSQLSSLQLPESLAIHWTKPTIVCEVAFREWTAQGKIRQPVFVGLRTDKYPTDVVRE